MNTLHLLQKVHPDTTPISAPAPNLLGGQHTQSSTRKVMAMIQWLQESCNNNSLSRQQSQLRGQQQAQLICLLTVMTSQHSRAQAHSTRSHKLPTAAGRTGFIDGRYQSPQCRRVNIFWQVWNILRGVQRRVVTFVKVPRPDFAICHLPLLIVVVPIGEVQYVGILALDLKPVVPGWLQHHLIM